MHAQAPSCMPPAVHCRPANLCDALPAATPLDRSRWHLHNVPHGCTWSLTASISSPGLHSTPMHAQALSESPMTRSAEPPFRPATANSLAASAVVSRRSQRRLAVCADDSGHDQGNTHARDLGATQGEARGRGGAEQQPTHVLRGGGVRAAWRGGSQPCPARHRG